MDGETGRVGDGETGGQKKQRVELKSQATRCRGFFSPSPRRPLSPSLLYGFAFGRASTALRAK